MLILSFLLLLPVPLLLLLPNPAVASAVGRVR